MNQTKYSTITFKLDKKHMERMKQFYALPWWKRLITKLPKQGKE